MKNKIGYLTFGRDDFSYGLALCLDALPIENVFRVTPKTVKYVDYLCFSVFWWEHIYLLADFLRRAGIKKADQDRPIIIIGGFNTFNPVPLLAYTDFVVCGDGENILPLILEGRDHQSVLTAGKGSATWNQDSTVKAFCHETNGIARIELARGCRYRCKFCAVAHLKPYREVEAGEIETLLRRTKQKRVSLFAPEPTMHSRDEELTELCHRLGKIRTDSDVRLDHLSKRSDSVPRVGIEGLSERLRKSINKPYTNKQILKAVREAIETGRKGMFMYMILDLPGEKESDWLEFKGLMEQIGKIPGSDKFVLKPSPSVFLPTPHTPMEFEGINWDRDYQGKWLSFFGRGADRDWEVIMAERSRVFSPPMRVLSMLATRAGEEFREVETELTRTKTIGISAGRVKCNSGKGLIGILKKYGGVDRYCGPYPAGGEPWRLLQIGKLGAEVVGDGR